MHRRRWLADRAPFGGGRDRAGPVDLEQKPQPAGIDPLHLRVMGGATAADRDWPREVRGVAEPSYRRSARGLERLRDDQRLVGPRAERCTNLDLGMLCSLSRAARWPRPLGA